MSIHSKYYDHAPHFERRIGGKRVSCGGTEPPTNVTEDSSGVLRVDIYPKGSNVHVGDVLVAESFKEYETQIRPPQHFSLPAIGEFACRAVADFNSSANY